MCPTMAGVFRRELCIHFINSASGHVCQKNIATRFPMDGARLFCTNAVDHSHRHVTAPYLHSLVLLLLLHAPDACPGSTASSIFHRPTYACFSECSAIGNELARVELKINCSNPATIICVVGSSCSKVVFETCVIRSAYESARSRCSKGERLMSLTGLAPPFLITGIPNLLGHPATALFPLSGEHLVNGCYPV